MLGTALAKRESDRPAVGAVFTAMLAGMALSSIVVGRVGDRMGRRSTYLLLLAAFGAVGDLYDLLLWRVFRRVPLTDALTPRRSA